MLNQLGSNQWTAFSRPAGATRIIQACLQTCKDPPKNEDARFGGAALIDRSDSLTFLNGCKDGGTFPCDSSGLLKQLWQTEHRREIRAFCITLDVLPP